MLNSYNLLNDTRYPACIFHHRGRNLFQHILFVHSALTCIANDALHLVNWHQNVRPTLSKNAKSTCHHGGQLKRPKCLASFFFTFTLDFFFHDMTGTFCPICLSQAKKDIHVIIIIYTLGNSKNIFFAVFLTIQGIRWKILQQSLPPRGCHLHPCCPPICNLGDA